jgi:hypothetical protein
MQPTNVPILDLRLKEFYQMVGQCIKAWATVEDKLFDICELILKTDRVLVAVVFFRQPTISARRDLTHDLLTARFPSTKQGSQEIDPLSITEWKRIKKMITDLLSARNSLAHDPVKMNTFHAASPADGRTLSSTHSFEVSTSDREGLRGKEKRRVLDIDLQQHLNRVNEITGELERFMLGALTDALR